MTATGPARFIPKEVMSSFNSALKNLSDEDIEKRYDPKAMDEAQLYASDIFADEGDEALDYVMQGIPQLRTFAEKCAATNSGALVGIY
jgi:triphosphoribosyl-dephospho-CoA synthetase